jgi:hypothetical protein
MSNDQITTSAALFFAGDRGSSIPLRFYDRAIETFNEFNLSPILFTAFGGGILHDDCYVLAERGDDISLWGEALRARAGELVHALRMGEVEYLKFDSPRAGSSDRSDWRADVGVGTFNFPMLYFGIDDGLIPDPRELLRRACALAEGISEVRYGFAYKMPLSQHPSRYAMGGEAVTLESFKEEARARRAGTYRKSADRLWQDEIGGKDRHLTGLFRGAYPVSILSEAHLQKADFLPQRIGKLSKLDSSLWLWELSDAEFPVAEELLESQGVLVRQQ